MAPDQGDGVHEGRRRLVVPGGPALGHGVPFLQRVSGQCGPGKETQQDGRGAGDGLVRPLALGLHAQVGPRLPEGDLQLPAQHKPLQDLGRVRRRVGTEQGLRGEDALGVSDQHPANEHGGLARAVPDRCLGGEFHRAGGAVIPGHHGTGPSHVDRFKQGFERGSPCAFQRRPTVLTRLTGWRWRVQGGVQTQSGDEGNRLGQRLAAVEQVQHGIAVVAPQHQGPMGQPAAQLQYHLPRPVGELFVPASLLAVVPRRGGQHREHRQGPMATGPRDVAQPHQGDPAQAAGLDQLLATGTHRVAVDAPRLDFGAATPFKGLVDAEHQRALAPVQVLEQQRQQDAGRRTGRPHRPVEHLMVAGVVALVAAAHDPQCCRHGALARGQDRAHQQHLGFPPGWVGKQRCEGNEYGYNDIGQGEHGWAFLWKVGSGQLTLSLYFSKLCVKSR